MNIPPPGIEIYQQAKKISDHSRLKIVFNEGFAYILCHPLEKEEDIIQQYSLLDLPDFTPSNSASSTSESRKGVIFL